LFDHQADEVVVERARCSTAGTNKDNAGRLASKSSRSCPLLRSSRHEAGRAEIARQTLYREHQALRFGYTPRSAVEEKRDIVDQRSAGHDDHGGDRKRGENFYQGEAITSGARSDPLHFHRPGALRSRIVSAVMT
jgi:hypothetical protein